MLGTDLQAVDECNYSKQKATKQHREEREDNQVVWFALGQLNSPDSGLSTDNLVIRFITQGGTYP